jgi:hypothetical protein
MLRRHFPKLMHSACYSWVSPLPPPFPPPNMTHHHASGGILVGCCRKEYALQSGRGLEVPRYLVAPLILLEIRYFVNISTIIATAESQQECTREGEKRGGAGGLR